MSNPKEFMNDTMAAPLGNLIASIGEGVADAQAALDAGSLAQTLALYDDEDGDIMNKRLREIGYQPTFYTIPETKVKAKISLAMSQSGNSSQIQSNRLSKVKMYATPINATNTNKYNLNVNASVELDFTIKPIPAPEGAELRRTPDLIGKTLSEAEEILGEFNLNYEITSGDSATTIASQIPIKGSTTRLGNTVELTFNTSTDDN
ncbi:PASTA domain-containing protein [uncultured Dokdonia sp.]|uniref:PASTA domain-containing protein n=1 Tax=uncultured Dokdonia sp. TaxID=575653 RepID=UPI002631F249|nr:PASTA domain-containing protein [uncultured Dokdonia sp.]